MALLGGCSSTWREDLSTPRIVQRDQPATIPLTTQDVGRFATHYDRVARGISTAKTPPADVKRHIPSFDQLLRLRVQNSPECDKPGERLPELSGSSDKLTGSDYQDSATLVGCNSSFEIRVVNRLHKSIDCVDRSWHSDSSTVK